MIFCLNDFFCLMQLTFRPQKRDKQLAPSGHQVLLEPFSSVSAPTVLETYTYLWYEGRFLEVEDTPTVDHPPPPHLPLPPPNCDVDPTPLLPQPPPPHQPPVHPPPPRGYAGTTSTLGLFLIAALIFSAGYYCAPIFFYFVELFFALPFCRFFDILREIFLTSVG